LRPVQFHPRAREEYDHEEAWYFERSAVAADRFDAEVAAALEAIASRPQSYPVVLRHVDLLVRNAPLERFPFRIVFFEATDQLVVLAVAHAKRRPRYWKDRLEP
jgi:plasmid stabilization system protein ParE